MVLFWPFIEWIFPDTLVWCPRFSLGIPIIKHHGNLTLIFNIGKFFEHDFFFIISLYVFSLYRVSHEKIFQNYKWGKSLLLPRILFIIFKVNIRTFAAAFTYTLFLLLQSLKLEI